MSTKDLFESSVDYLSDTNQKDAFSDAESSRNVKAVLEKQNTFEPQVDYSEPSSFAKFGSAELYYDSAIDRIIDFYPYDGSDAEYNEFFNKSLSIEKYIFNNLYPRTTGYVNFDSSSISLKGGPHTISSTKTSQLFKDPESSQRATSNIYDEDLYKTAGLPSDYGDGTRESNLKCDFEKGVTVEFWLKSNALDENTKQAIFHLTNSSGGDDFTIFLSGTTGSPFFTTLTASNTAIFGKERLGSTPDTSSIQDWNHYAVTFKSSSNGINTKFYLNGVLDSEKQLGSFGTKTLTQKNTLAHIASGSHNDGYLFFSGSMDEFRFWKTERSNQDIGRNWFTQVRGGSNTDINNTTLGVYYKFNEGITGVTATDSVVLDYSGRLSNGTFNNYTTTSRNTGSAIVSASAASKEYEDPIIYSTHPDVASLKTTLVNRGRDHDYRNGSSFDSFLPSWIFEEHEDLGNKNFKFLSHIVGSYFDKLYLQIEALPTFKSALYTSSSYKPLPFASNLPTSLGLQTTNIFVDSTVLEKFSNRNETQNFEFDLEEVKNLIYLNLYNNATYIFKSKGTEKAIRNVLKSFNIDDKLVRFNAYANNYVYELENNLKQIVLKKSSANFNNKDHLSAVVYSSASSDATQLGHILGSGLHPYEQRYGMTHEVDVVFPKFIRKIDTFNRDFTRVSLFGIHRAEDAENTRVLDPSIYVYALRDEEYSKNVKFVLSSSLLSQVLTSSNYLDVYGDEKWNLSARLKPLNIGLTGSVADAESGGYQIEFAGFNERLGEIRNSFVLSASSNEVGAKSFLSSSKRIFLGAHRTDITGTVQHKSDVLVSSTRFWTQYIDDATLQQHALDFENSGITDQLEHLSPLDPENSKTLNLHTLALNYEFNNVTSSDAAGGFTVTDVSSGSVANRTRFGKLGEISSYLYPGIGFGFEANASDVVVTQDINAHQFINPEIAISDNLVKIRTDDDKLFDTYDTIPNYHYILEKSFNAAVSEEMLNFFAGVSDFHQLIGAPVNQYRMNYKGLEKLREIFFRKVTDVKEVEKFIEYYKWFDDAVSTIIAQLVPASADYSPNVLNTIESHVLERNKYQYRLPLLAFTSSTEGTIFGSQELRYNWNKNHAPISGLQSSNFSWWKDRAERAGSITSGDATVDNLRERVKRVKTNKTDRGAGEAFTTVGQKYNISDFKYRTLSKAHIFETKIGTEIKGGVNFEQNKDIHYTYTALHPAGPITTEEKVFVPKNVLLAFTDELVALQDSDELPVNPNDKIKRTIKVRHGRDFEDSLGYKNTKSSFSFPFNIVSSSVTTGYNKLVVEGVTASVEITNLHNDVYGPDMERPMQGPFTDFAVGGHQSRHIKLNTGNDDYLNRPEAWKILLGTCANTSGAIGMVGADYPWPEANAVGATPYPLTGAQKAVYFRDHIAKRPVNIRNIKHNTGSTNLGNYEHNYQVVHTVGGYSNPRAFIDQQPTLPVKAVGADTVRTILDSHRGEKQHFQFIDEYNIGYLSGSSDYKNKTVIRSRFSAPGSRESLTFGFRDFRSGDFSVYNSINSRNLTVRRPSQGVTASIVSETTGIRNFDHTGRDFGFTNLAARHATRFYRDSVFQPDSDFSNVPRNTPNLTGPGKADDAFTESPSFHKIHRNNILKPREVTSTIQVPSPLNLTNENALYMLNAGPTDGVCAAAKSADQVNAYLTGSRISGSTFSAWVRIEPSRNNQELFSVGLGDGSVPFVNIEKLYRGGSAPIGHVLQLEIRVLDGSSKRTNQFVAVENDLDDGNIHHIAVCYDSTISGSGVDFYVDGVKKTTVETNYFSSTFITQVANSYTFRGLAGTTGDRYYTLGNTTSTNGSSNRFSGSFDQVSVWTTKLSEAQIQDIYNSGNPYNITASTVYNNNPSALHAWWTFEASNGDRIDSSNPKAHSDSNRYVDSSGNGYDLFAIASSGDIDQDLSDGSPPPVSGDSSTTSETVISYVVDNKYDNLNLNHQIPRSDRQYSWFAHSVTHTSSNDARYSGFMRVDTPLAPYYEITGNYYPFFDYVSASATTSGIFQNTTRLDLLVTDKTGSAINTLGETTITTALQSPVEGERLNALLIHRGDTYGWNWRAFRQQDHPILNREHKQNLLTALKGTTIKEFRLPPVSVKGRPIITNMSMRGQNISLKSTNNNEKIYFNQTELNDLVYQNVDTTLTPFDDTLGVAQELGSSLNWINYKESIFPSTRNEFSSGSRERLGFDNKFWRDNRTERTIIGSIDAGDGFGLNSFGQPASQSAWILDAPSNFLTRNSLLSGNSVSFTDFTGSEVNKSGSAGELQNEYLYSRVNTPAGTAPGFQLLTKAGSYRLSSVLSRRHMLTSPNSVVSRTGFAKTGSLEDTFTDNIPTFAGEALWEAGSKASILVKSGSSFSSSLMPSEPWFDKYSDFSEDLQLVARGYSIVPEFRISEHVTEYVNGGLFNKSNFDVFEIPETGISSSTQNFYKDYSNSDFLKEFADIKDKSGLDAKEIMLTCKAAVRFNPYKGFYPAQRTIDLASQFSNSFGGGFAVENQTGDVFTFTGGGVERPIIKPLFSPGILYNSIKSGIAVDYPIKNNPLHYDRYNFSGSNTNAENYCLTPTARQTSVSSKFSTASNYYDPREGPFWDFRLPFETIVEPGKFIDKVKFLDFESHPSGAIVATASVDTAVSDGIYELMASNFLGQTGEFFLKDSSYTSLKSNLIQDGLKFNDGEVYAARLKIRKSHNGKRFYNLESGSDGTSNSFTAIGAKATTGQPSEITFLAGGFPLPQDPAHNLDFNETFTMYSRPSAFGPAISGRPGLDVARFNTSSHTIAFDHGTMDSLEGFNWAYTPPYYHGESWIDFIFRPVSTKTYTLEDILTDTKTVHWRVDPGMMTGSDGSVAEPMYRNQRLLIDSGYQFYDSEVDGVAKEHMPIYGAQVINGNAMQLTASLNIFGVERVPKKRKDKFGKTIVAQNELAGKRWVIQPKWETPMLNFADVKEENNNITYPTNFSESVPRGIWHQFGTIPSNPDTGIFLEIGDIPKDWLRFHYDVTTLSSSYNNFDPEASGSSAPTDYKSLTDLFGFQRSEKKDSLKKRLGEIADKREIYEAIVAIPYVIESSENYSPIKSNNNKLLKKFINIPRERFQAALKEREGSLDGDSIELAGQSIRRMVQKMKRYVIPPQFDFINFDEIDPIVMYFFEFKYEFDKDDLSYIWQNLAPRDYKKITFQKSSVAHNLMSNELIEQKHLLDNPNLRWMVFKVKQRAQKEYFDLIPPQIKDARKITRLDKRESDKDDEYIRFNWPYDYLSFVELVNIETDILYKSEPPEDTE